MEHEKRRPLILLGLDGSDWTLVEPWMAAGLLPTLRRMRQEGTSCGMTSTIPPITAPALASFMTGLGPAATGLTGFIRPGGGVVSFNDIRNPCIWDYLGAAGIRSLVVGLRLTYPPREISGVMLSGGLLRARGDDYITPRRLLEKSSGYHPERGKYPETHRVLKRGAVGDPARLADELVALTRRQFQVFSALGREEPFPFSLLYVENTDFMQHFLWHRPELLLRLYQAVDEALAALVAERPEANVLLMSDHGFAAAPERIFYVNEWLAAAGFLEPVRGGGTGARLRRALRRAKQAVSAAVPTMTKRKMRLLLTRVRRNRGPAGPGAAAGPTLAQAAAGIGFNPLRTAAFAAEPWGIRLTGAGEPAGLLERIRAAMERLAGEDGMPLFNAIQSAPAGVDRSAAVADITFVTQPNYRVDIDLSGRLFAAAPRGRPITGSHDQSITGVFLAWGPDVDPGTKVSEFAIADFLPTILEYFGLVPPGGIDGVSKAAAVFRRGAAPRKEAPVAVAVPAPDAGPAYSAEEEAQIKERLRNLGYLDP